MTNKVVTFGCRLNSYESSAIKDLAGNAGLSDVIIVNTCAVTNEAERQARQSIRRLKKENPGHRLFVTGCAAQIKPEMFSSMKEVDVVIGNNEKMLQETYQNLNKDVLTEKVIVNDIFSVTETATHLVSGFDVSKSHKKARAFIQVQNGCDHRCTFCTIPYGRGNSRSVNVKDVLDQITHLKELGYVEFVLTGVDLTSYNKDTNLSGLIRQILNNFSDIRLRISSIDVSEVDEEFFDIMADKRVMPHLHLSLQSGDNLILKRMKRRHVREEAIDFCEKIRKIVPDIIIGADLIVGFPTESDECFQNTIKLIDECGLSLIHFFPYSAKEGTPASKMPQVPSNIIKERVKIISLKSKEALKKAFNFFNGKSVNVLMETNDKGKTDHFLEIKIDDIQIKTDETIVKAKIIDFDDKTLYGQKI